HPPVHQADRPVGAGDELGPARLQQLSRAGLGQGLRGRPAAGVPDLVSAGGAHSDAAVAGAAPATADALAERLDRADPGPGNGPRPLVAVRSEESPVRADREDGLALEGLPELGRAGNEE